MANETLNTVLNIQPKDSGGGGGETREASVQRMASEMLEKLPPDYVPHEVKMTYESPAQNIVSKRSFMLCIIFSNSTLYL